MNAHAIDHLDELLNIEASTRASELQGLPAGMLEYSARTAIRDLMRVYGFESGRQIVAEILNDEASGRRQS